MSKISATTTVELEIGLTGVYQPPVRGMRERGGQQLEPDEDASVEDIDIEAMTFERVERRCVRDPGGVSPITFETIRHRFNLFDGVDLKDPNVSRLIANIVEAVGADAVEILLTENAE